MTNKLEQLKAAHEASTQGEWRYKMYEVDAEHKEIAVLIPHYTTAKVDGLAIALAHNMMDDLLEAVDALGWIVTFIQEHAEWAEAQGFINSDTSEAEWFENAQQAINRLEV